MATMIRLRGGPGDGLHLAITVRGHPPARIVYDPDAITVVAVPTGVEPEAAGAGAVYTRGEKDGDDWAYEFEG